MSRRVQRVESELRQIIAEFLQKGFKGHLPAMISITRVKASGDLRAAKVYFQVIGDESLRPQCLEELQARSKNFQSEVARRLPMKFCPKLQFLVDEGMDHLLQIEKSLHELRNSDES